MASYADILKSVYADSTFGLSPRDCISTFLATLASLNIAKAYLTQAKKSSISGMWVIPSVATNWPNVPVDAPARLISRYTPPHRS